MHGSCIGLLLSGGDVARTASTETTSHQKVVEIPQRRQGDARRADLHADAGRGVEHPVGHHRHDAGQHLDVHEPPRVTIVGPLDPDTTAEQRMPAAMDDGIVPDMGRVMALTRKNALFAGHEVGAENWAMLASLVATCKMSDVDPVDYFATTLRAILDGYPLSFIDDLMPWHFRRPSSLAA